MADVFERVRMVLPSGDEHPAVSQRVAVCPYRAVLILAFSSATRCPAPYL